MRRRLPVLAALLLLAGCASGIDSAVFMPAAPLPAGQEVRVYQTTMPACAYDEVGIVTWEPRDGWQKLEKGVQLMRARARQMGGHAIIGFSIGQVAVGSTTTATRTDSASVTLSSSVNREKLVAGTVVRFRDAGCVGS
jgi:hypothetical protein